MLIYFKLFSIICSLFFAIQGLAIYSGKPIQKNSPGYRSEVKLYHKTDQGYEYHCSGVLIKNNVVLTAGHCVVDDDGSLYQIQVGFDPIEQMSTEESISVEKSYVHPLYKAHQRRIVNDLAILILQHTSPTPYIPTKVLTQPELFRFPSQVHVAGSGFYGFIDKNVGFNKKENLLFNKRLTADRTAVSLEHLFYDPYKILFHSEVGEITHPDGSLCFGDSGGPHYAMIQGQWQLVGISSSTTSNCLAGEATAVHVGGYLNWIESTLQKHFQTSTTFGFSQNPQSAEWKSNVFPTSFQKPNTAQNPHFECNVVPGIKPFKAPKVVNLSFVSMKPYWKKSIRNQEYLFRDTTVDIKVVTKDSIESYFSGQTNSNIQSLYPFQSQTIFDFEYYPHVMIIDFPNKQNHGTLQMKLIDEDANVVKYSCSQRRAYSSQLVAKSNLKFFNQDISIYSAIANGGKICEIPAQTKLVLENFSFDYNIFDAHIKPELSTKQTDSIPECIKQNPFLVDGIYGIEF